jgi:DNA-binding transcriptional ArsR family regulator
VPETEDSQVNIAAIRTRLDNLERMTRLAIASNPHNQRYIEQVFRGRGGSAELYLALAQGPRTQEELTAILKKSQPTVSRIIKHLYENGIIDRLPTPGALRWMWHDMEQALGISHVARRLGSKSTRETRLAQQGDEKI